MWDSRSLEITTKMSNSATEHTVVGNHLTCLCLSVSTWNISQIMSHPTLHCPATSHPLWPQSNTWPSLCVASWLPFQPHFLPLSLLLTAPQYTGLLIFLKHSKQDPFSAPLQCCSLSLDCYSPQTPPHLAPLHHSEPCSMSTFQRRLNEPPTWKSIPVTIHLPFF